MAGLTDIRVPDLGDFKDVEIIEVHVKAGDVVAVEQPLITEYGILCHPDCD